MYGDYEEERTAVQPSDPGSEKTLSMAVAAVDGDSRQIIDIVFKLIGKCVINIFSFEREIFCFYPWGI